MEMNGCQVVRSVSEGVEGLKRVKKIEHLWSGYKVFLDRVVESRKTKVHKFSETFPKRYCHAFTILS